MENAAYTYLHKIQKNIPKQKILILIIKSRHSLILKIANYQQVKKGFYLS